MKNHDLAIVVLSCDKFSSLWPLFFKRFEKYFSYELAEIYLLSNHADFVQEKKQLINVRCIGEDLSWSSNLRKLLGTLHEENVLLFMDDAPLSKSVDIEKFKAIYDEFTKKDMQYINLKASPSPNRNVGKDFGEIVPGTGYRTAIVPSLWKKSTLLSLLKDDENAWQFEIYGSDRSKEYNRFFSVNSPAFEFDHIVIKGKIDRRVYSRLKAKGEHHNLNFPVMNRWEYFEELARRLRAKLVRRLVPTLFVSRVRALKYKK